MKYEKTDLFEAEDGFEERVADAMSEIKDEETEAFLSAKDLDAEISEDLDRRIQALIEKKSTKETFQSKYYPRILSTAALIIFVAFFFSFAAMMSTFVKFSWNGTEQPPETPKDTFTDAPTDTGASFLPADSYISQSETAASTETSRITGHSGKQTEMTNPSAETTGRIQGGTDPVRGETPSDEKRVFCIIHQSNSDGIFIWITISGYQSESLGKEFYVKSNEYFTVDVEIKNTSDRPIYYTVYTDCSESAAPHSHENALGLSYMGHEFCSSCIGFSCGSAASEEALKPGESYTYQLKYAPGTEVASGFDLPGDGTDYAAGVKLYDEVFYTFFDNGSCTFEGYFKFKYYTRINSGSVSFWIPLSLEVVYVA